MASRSHRGRRLSLPDHRRQIVVFTEGEKTEVSYINHWASLYRRRVNVIIEKKRGVPWTLVDAAVTARRADSRQHGRREGQDEYWCVFDVNNHPKIHDSLQRAQANDINLAVSNPCIELWFILHYRRQTGHIEGRDAQRDCGDLLDWRRKALPTPVLDVLEGRFEDAKRRAQALDEMHVGDGRQPRANPSSDVWRLVDRIRGV